MSPQAATGRCDAQSHTYVAQPRYEVTFKVEAHEDVTAPAVSFKAFRAVPSDAMSDVDTRLSVPDRGGLLVKRVTERPPPTRRARVGSKARCCRRPCWSETVPMACRPSGPKRIRRVQREVPRIAMRWP